MPDLLAGSQILALDTPPTQSAIGDPTFDLTSATFTTAATAGSYTEVAVVFTAPTTGRIKWTASARLINSATGGTLVTCEVREGATIGSGTVVDVAADRGPSHYGASFARLGTSRMVSGLTPGATYNARLLHRVTTGTGSIALRELIVEPCT